MARPRTNLRLPSKPGVRPVGRTVKMLFPRCEVCQAPENVRPRWWETCEHSPYQTHSERPETTPTLDTLDDGTVVKTGEQTRIVYETGWNLVQIKLSERVNSGRGIERARAKGMLLPEEKGLSPFCQYFDCWSQDIRYRTAHGDYCNERQAKEIALEEIGEAREVHDERKAAEQLARIAL